MTRCKHCSYNYQLKSSAYNPTGECLEVQLTSYNAMTNHLRRILMAKSVVDSGKMDKRVPSRRDVKMKNVKTLGMGQQRSDIDSNSKVSHSLSQNDIDRLVYDTKHHPNKIANLTCRRSRHRIGCSKCDLKKSSNRSYSTDSSDDSVLRGHREALKYYEKRINDDFEEIRKFGKSDLEVYLPRVKSASSEEIPEFIASLLPGTRSSSHITDYADLTIGPRTKQDVVDIAGNEDASIYVKFVYDITKEVMDRGLYADSEIDAVFQRHFDRNLGTLNKRKMKLEINRLRRSLNMNSYDSDEDEDEAEEYQTASRNSDKIIKKHETDFKKPGIQFSRIKENEETSLLVVTKEDILNTLLELNLNPDAAREICNGLQNRSNSAIPRVENRLPDGNELRDSGLRNEGTGKKLNNSDRSLGEEENSGKEIKFKDKKKTKTKSRGISNTESESDSEENCAQLESGLTDFPVVISENSKITNISNGKNHSAEKNIIIKTDVAMSDDNLTTDKIKVEESDNSRSISTAEDSDLKLMLGNGFEVASEAQGQGNPSPEHEIKSQKKLEGGNGPRKNSINEGE